MIQIRDLIDHFKAVKSEYHQHCEWTPDRLKAMRLIEAILENFWIEGEPGHEEYHVHPKAFGDEKDVRI